MTEIRAGGHVIGDHGWEVASATPSPAAYDPADHTVAEVKDYVGDDAELAEQVLELEQSGKDRVSLVEALEAVIEQEPES